MIEYILNRFSGLKVVKDSSTELYNPTERSTIGRQMKAHKNALSHLKEVNTIYISHNGHQSNFNSTLNQCYIISYKNIFQNLNSYLASWYTINNGNSSISREIRKYINENIDYFNNADHFTMSHLYDENHDLRSSPTAGNH